MMRSPRLWIVLLVLAGIHDCGIALYHLVLPYQMSWRRGLEGVADSLVWALFALNFSWSMLVLLVGSLVLYAAKLGPPGRSFVRRAVFTVGLFWGIHGTYTWLNPLPLPRSMVMLRYVLGLLPLLAVALHWLPLVMYRADYRREATLEAGKSPGA
jgi:hypothetical protein